MKRKVFSLMMALLLAFVGVAKAEVVTIGEGTTTYYYYPVNMYFNYSLTEELYTPDEIGTAGTINAISFYYDYSSSFSMSNVSLYMKNVTRESFASNLDMEPLALDDIVWTGTFSASEAGWVTITLDTPFAYDGTSNLLVAAFDGTSGYPGSAYKFRTSPCEGYKGIHWYSDSYTPDPYNTASGFSGSKSYTQYRANIQLDITPGGGASVTETITIGEGTSTYYYYPVNMYFNYSMTEQIFTADEIGTAGTISSIAFYYDYANAFSMDNITMYMKNVARDAFASNLDMESLALGDIVWTGTLSATEAGWITIELDTPFAYNGTDNLLVACHDGTSGYPGSAYKFRTTPCEGYKGIAWYSDNNNYVPDPYNLGSGYNGSKLYTQYRNNIQLTITTNGGSGVVVPDELHVAYLEGDEYVVDSLSMGVRPDGCWMEPFTFKMFHDFRVPVEVTDIDFTPQGIFSLVEELPFTIARNDTIDLSLSVAELGQAGLVEVQMVALYGTGRTAAVWPLTVELYTPEIPDVWEKAYVLNNGDALAPGFSYQGIPSQITPTVLHNDYTLPFPEIEEGEDAVYKFTVDQDVIINAYVDPNAENGKVALYTEDFYGEGGPMAHNNYTGLGTPGSSTGGGTPFVAQIGEGTSTSNYFPFHTLWNYSLAENLFLASELTEAGVTTAPMTSLSWYVSSMTTTTAQNNISIWMANVGDEALTGTSHTTAGMTLVYTGNGILPTAGQWNEFVFNAGNFAWDGHSNILILCQRNNGSWQGSISWQTHNPGFAGMSYAYNDNNPYDAATQTYSMSTSSTNRANIIFKGGNREGIEPTRELVTIAPGGYNAVAIPVNFIWAYTENQMILTADEIGTDGSITSVAYKRFSEGSGNPETRNIDIYMKHTTTDVYASTADWIPVSAADLVYSGNYTFQTTGEDWQTITLQTPFAYNGTDNLLICIDDNTGTTSTRQYWSCHSTSGARSMRAWGSSNFDPTAAGTPAGGSSLTGTFVADIQLNIGAAAPVVPVVPVEYNYSAGPVIEDLPLRAGTYYLAASATQADYDVFINIDQMPCPAIEAEGFAFNPTPADNEDEVEPGSVTLRWMVPEYATGWRLIFGSTYHPEANHPQTIIYPEDGSFTTDMANSFTVRNLWNNTNYFWRVEFNNDGCPDGVSSPIWGFTTHLNIPQNLTAVDYTVFNDQTITLNWNAVVDRTYRMYNVYRDGVCIGHTTVNNIGNTTYTDGPLAYNMGGYEYYVTAVYDEGESLPSDPVTVKVSGYGDVDGHVYEQDGETGIAGATVTMVGQDEFGDNHTYNFTTNAQGYYSGHIYAGEYNGSASCNGYQTIDAPVQGNPIDITYNQTTSPIDYILDENFDPVCTVIAQYYPDSLDPEAPYVKVYWGCGLPGEEIIEPFETGDFSLFNWNISGSYPWEVTTTHPYEGTYCMRSTNYNIASSTSSIDVTVDIPGDGIMSFYGYISSESSWDYGYFYIDGVQKGQYTGAGNSWGEKKFDITAGSHNFKWEYTKDGSVNSNEDRFYVDYITFYKRPEPAQPGWHTYCESEFNNALGSNVGTPRWAYEYPVSVLGGYAGFTMTKVSLFSDNMYSAVGGNYTCVIYRGGNEPMAGEAISTITVDVPQNQNAWVDYDLTTPVPVTGTETLWVVWTANTQLSSWPAGLCGDMNDYGNWWSAGLEAGYGWEHNTYGTYTMRHYFTNRGGEGFYSYASDDAANIVAPTVKMGAPVMPVKGQEIETITCANPNAVKGAAVESNTRAFAYYRVYRTDCYNDGPYTEENTVLLASELLDTIYIDVDWPDVAPGVYKWGVGVVYSGNRGELYESPIAWTTPTIVRDVTADNTTNPVAGEDNGNRAPWDLLNSFDCTSGYQYGVATDGNYIYTSSWSASSSSQFYKYNMDGTFVEEFNVSGSGQIRDLTYDGQYFYGVANSSTVYCLDLANHTLVNSFTSAYGTMRCCGYDAERDGFWVVGNWSGNLTLINRSGAIQITGPAPTSASGVAYYKDSNNVEHVYCFDNSSNLIYDYDIASNTIVGTVFNFSAVPGYNSGTSGGCHIGNYGDKLAFYGDLQQSPNLIGIYELQEAGNPNPGNNGTNNPIQEERESEIVWSNCLDKDMYLTDGVDITVLLNSADSPEGTTVSFENYNEFEQEMYPVADVVLDETGFYAWDSFRKGEYKVTVTLDGYETVVDSVSIWDPTHLRYVLIEIIYGVDNLYVSRTGWAMWDAQGMPSNGGGGGQGGNGDTFDENFDNGMPAGWTTVDADGDGLTWVSSMTPGVYHNSGVNLEGTGHNSSAHYVISGSYANGTGQALHPDNFLVSPQVNLVNGSTFSFWACAQDASWAAEHFGVAISSNGTTDWTMVNEWTMTAKANGAMSYGRDGETRAQGNWYNYTVDLSAYAGQKYIGIRHFNCTDMFILNVDDITLTNGAKNADNERHLEHFKVLCESIDHEPIFNANTVHPFCQLTTDQLVEGEHYICKVAAVYSTGVSDWVEVEWEYEACDNYTPIEGLEITTPNEGNHLVWEFNGGGGGGGQGGQGDAFTVDFESGMPAGWNVIDANNDGYTWCMTSNIPNTWTYYSGMSLDWYHNGTNAICSGSYINGVGALNPDEYLVTPLVNIVNGSTFSFYAAATDASYAADHFGVFVSDNGTSNWTMVNEWTLTAKKEGMAGGSASRNGEGLRLGNWYTYSVDLSAFAGQKYIAIRHFNCTDQYIMCVDDIELTAGAKNRAAWEFFNGYVTDPGAMSNGGDASWIKGSQSTYGPGCQMSSSNRVGDVFTLDATTTINEIEVYGYQTGSSTNSTFNGLYVQIYDGNPMNGANVVWGDANANIMTATAFTNCYRGSDGDASGTTRPIMSVTASGLDIQLEAGTYYLVYQLNGTGSSGPWAQPHAEPGIGNTGNGVQYLGSSSAWQNLTDSGAGTPYGVAMKLTGNTGGGQGPTPVEGVLGFMIFRDGEWLAELLDPNAREYTDVDDFDAHEYCVRVIYDGTAVLPSNNFYYAMSCPVCEGNTGIACVAGDPIHADLNQTTDQVKIWWGTEPAAPIEEWLYYDDGEMVSAMGAGGAIYWAIMLPSTSLGDYAGTNLTQVAVMEYNSAGSYTANIYLGGTSAPGTLVSTQEFSCTGTQDWKYVTLNTPVAIDGTQNVWITMYQAGINYPATACTNTGDPNGRWVSVDGSEWIDITTAGNFNYTWMLRGYVTNQAKGGQMVALPGFNGEVGSEISSVEVEPVAPAFSPMNRAEIVKYNVYRSTDNETYTMIGEVPVNTTGYYEYIDTPEVGTYYYQVRAYYDNDCESDPAPSFDNPANDYVMITVALGVDENGGMAIFPNPTKGNVTIQANGMSHITVVSVLGQVVYDADVDTNEVILNMSQYSAGMYTVRVVTENGVRVERITVVR